MGELLTHHKDKSALQMMTIANLIETKFSIDGPVATHGDFVKIVEKSKCNVFPVVEADDIFPGVIFINDIREVVFKSELYDTTYMSSIMFMPEVYVDSNATMEEVAQKFSVSALTIFLFSKMANIWDLFPGQMFCVPIVNWLRSFRRSKASYSLLYSGILIKNLDAG